MVSKRQYVSSVNRGKNDFLIDLRRARAGERITQQQQVINDQGKNGAG